MCVCVCVSGCVCVCVCVYVCNIIIMCTVAFAHIQCITAMGNSKN